MPQKPNDQQIPDLKLRAMLNYRRVTDRILTAGQPTEAQMTSVALVGVRTVINLALPTSTGALPNERATVEGLGMQYIPIPVNFAAPTEENWEEFCQAMDVRPNETLLVHCAMNYRVSAFLAIYGVRRWGWSRDNALREMRQLWEPDAVWMEFLASHGVK
ncbi:MAG TPA: protein tyrosine phosphatase family protein [Verrucomicrobiota bacterium]|nr:phosphatase [Verrucomicrobiales bacterium]HRI11489.1 protein tyrosine phosphatase family protein [Verrucomicrobiota bacterium]